MTSRRTVPMLRALLLHAPLLIPCAPPAVAGAPILWTVETLDDFERGKPTGVAVQSDGSLALTPQLNPTKVPLLEESADPFLWSQALDSKGTLYVGGGKNGAVYRVPRGAAGSLYFETGDLAVHALAVDRNDVLYAGSSPQGKIHRITGEARGEVYYDPEDRYIWALVAGAKGELYAATGERGIIYRITARGKAETFFDSEEAHIVALALDPQGNLLAGSDGRGLLYRIDPQGRATVLHDSPLREISAVAVDGRGAIYAAALGVEGESQLPPLLPQRAAFASREAAPGGLPEQPTVPIPGIEAGPAATIRVTASASAAPAAPLPRSEVYRIDPDGTVITLWSSETEVVFALAVDARDRPIIGTGEPGRIRALDQPQRSTLLALLPQSQVTSLAAGPGRQIFAATSNLGRLYTLDSTTSESGTYLSVPHDALALARWGRVAWRASLPPGARIDLATRSGNSGVPDATWSDWSPAYADPEGSAVSSPAARHLQWRARLNRQSGGLGPTLRAVSIAYLQANLPPALKRLTVLPPGVVRERSPYAVETDPADLAFTGIRAGPGGRAANGTAAGIVEKKIYVRGMRALEWEADDPNGDILAYDLFFRGEEESAWKPLAKALRETYFAFDSMQLPDGLYLVRVEAGDAPSNPGDTRRSASLDSDTILVDNTPPVVQVSARRLPKGGGLSIETTATDGVGPITRADYSLDAAAWTAMQPGDGVSDSRAETYGLVLESMRTGEHTVIVKVSDFLGNVGAGKATFTVP